MGNGVERIESCAFDWLDELIEVSLPSSVEYLGWGIFDNCTKLTDVVMPDVWSCEEMGKYMFVYCSSLTSIKIPDGVKIIRDGCFLNSGLENVNFVNRSGIIKIEDESFAVNGKRGLDQEVKKFIEGINPNALKRRDSQGFGSTYEIIYEEQI